MRKLHVAFGELVLAERSFKDVDSNMRMDHGKLTFDFRAAGVQEGTLQGEGTFVPGANGTADLNLKIDLANVRASLASEGLSPTDVPPLGLAMNIKIHGSSPRQMAAGANGQLLLTQGAGKTKSGLISAYGGGVLSQLSEKLNPFAKDDPFMTLDCTIARADIVNGQGHGETGGPPDRKGHHYRRRQDRPAHRETDDRLQHTPAQRHRRESGHVHQPAHSTRRNIGEPEELAWARKEWHRVRWQLPPAERR